MFSLAVCYGEVWEATETDLHQNNSSLPYFYL